MSLNDDVAYAMTPFKLLTLPLGVWPLQKYNAFSLVRFIVCIFSLTVLMIMLFLEINFGSSDAYVKLDALMVMFCAVLSILKLLSFRLYADNLICNFSSAVTDYHAIDNEEKRTIMRQHAFMGRMIFYSILFFAYVASSIFVLTPMIAGNKDVQVNLSIKSQAAQLPLPMTWTLKESNISTNLFLLISAVQYFLMVLNSTSDCGGDAVFLAIVLHVCGQIELLKIDFINYGVNNQRGDISKLTSRHSYLIKHAKLLVEVISSVLLVQVLFSCLIISLIGFQLILALKSHDVIMITKTITVLSALLLQLFFFCFVGDYLKCQMEDIADSIYNSNWYFLSTKLMRNVLFVIMRSQKPVQLLAGNFFLVNIKTFMNILKSSLSYLSVLRVMVDA
ncbi:odorant receptor 2a-like [Solenopsis invicta]|uniref:odorant receptor 2a-like n=1 Tax=Solenopsis invicta TaxID=13686 RepID=UPI00193CD5E2|nr:odorant receptor 2a-like [Solenopsis invicta]